VCVCVAPPIKVIIRFATVAHYCYSFCKKVCERLRNLSKAILPEFVFNLLCEVTSVLLKHLHAIGWSTVIAAVGGWVRDIIVKTLLGW